MVRITLLKGEVVFFSNKNDNLHICCGSFFQKYLHFVCETLQIRLIDLNFVIVLINQYLRHCFQQV